MKVIVTASRRYWALGRCFEQGDTEAEVDEAQRAELDAAAGGEYLSIDQRAPGVLSYRIVADPPPPPAEPDPVPAPEPEPVPAPELAITDGPTETPTVPDLSPLATPSDPVGMAHS